MTSPHPALYVKTFGFLLLLVNIITMMQSCHVSPERIHTVEIKQEACIYPHSDYTYHTGNNLEFIVDGEEFIIPKGFETDLASIPRIFWSVISPQYSAFMTPSIIHDYFYRCDSKKNRQFADDVFYYALKEKGISAMTTINFYLIVRWFGTHSYTNKLPCAYYSSFINPIENFNGQIERATYYT